MRFRFCWDVDCPDWLLAEIATLSKLTSVKLRLLTATIAKSILGQEFSYDTVTKLAIDAKLDENGARAMVAAVRWVLESAAGAKVAANILDEELQQLGLPREHAGALTKVYIDQQSALEQQLRNSSLKVNGDLTWTCDVFSVQEGQLRAPVVQLTSHKEGIAFVAEQVDCLQASTILITTDQLDALVHELEEARRMMADLL